MTMIQTIDFNSWFYSRFWIGRVLLMIILFAAVAQFASFALIQPHVISFYGAQPEDISFGLQIAYAGIITALPIQFRLVKYSNTRSYLLTVFVTGVSLNVGFLFTEDLVIFSVLRFLTGAITCMTGGCLLMAILSTLPESSRMIVGISMFFSLILTCSVIVGIGTSWIVLNTNWTSVYYGLIGLQLVAIILCFAIFKSMSASRPYPLYQIDWIGSILFTFTAGAIAFIMIYGPKRDWLRDPLIRNTAVFATLIFLLWILRQRMIKRPLIDLNSFKHGKFIIAILLMLLFWGIKDSINLIYGYSVSVLGWSSANVVNVGLFNTAGVVAAIIVAVKVILVQKKNLPKLLLLGFGMMSIYHLIVYFCITPDLSFSQLCIPVFIHGVACGLLFVPITLFCVASLPQSMVVSGIVICAYARFIATLNSIAGFYSLQQHYNQHFKLGFLSKLIAGNDIFSQRQQAYKSFITSQGYSANEAASISNMLIAKSSAIQAQLLTTRVIFLIGAIITTGVLIVLILFAVMNKIKQSNHDEQTASQ